MSLIPYEPFHQLENIRREFDRFFTTEMPAIRSKFGQRFGPLNVDVYETESEVIASIDIPGLEKKEDVHIDIDNNLLSVSGAINRVNEVKEEQLHRQERFYGRFQRSISLPTQVSTKGVKATYKNGVLEVRMPKIQSENRKRIDVDFH